MYLLKRLIESCLSPAGIMILLLAGGLLLTFFKRNPKLRNRLLILGVSFYILFICSPLAEIMIGTLERHYPPLLKVDRLDGVKMIVVLSDYGEEHPTIPVNNNISEETVCRIAEGIRLYHQIPHAKLLFSGGTLRRGDKPIANIMADFVKTMGVAEGDILVEGNSQNTYENLFEVRKLLGTKPFILVTSSYHLRRAMAVAHKLKMRPVAAPAHIWTLQHFPTGMTWPAWTVNVLQSFGIPSQERLTYLQRAYHEYAGYLWYQWLDWL